MHMPVNAPWIYKTFWVLIRGFYPLFCRMEVVGAEHVPLEGGCVLACNHSMGPDYFLLGVATPRQIHYMGKAELFHIHQLVSKTLLGAGVFPVERGKQDMAAVEQAAELVRGGSLLGMFPEGTRSRTGLLQRGKSGAARIALASGAPVVPAVVINSSQVFRTPFRVWKRPKVTVRFGEPLHWHGNPAGDGAAARAYTEWIMRSMAQMLPEELRGYYADEADGTDDAE